MLSPARVIEVGETSFDHERDAIRFAQDALPNTDPYQLWALVELLDLPTGRLYEIDLLVLGYSALYLVEIKSGPGRYEGDQVDWYRTPPGGASRWMDPPYKLANHKAKVLASRLAARMKEPHRMPWVQALVFLASPEVDLRLKPEGMVGVVTRATLAQAITHHRFPAAPQDWRAERIATPVTRDVTQALAALGVRPRKGKLHVGAYELGYILDDHGAGYQDRLAVHRENRSFRRRARTYLVPQQTSVERRQQLRRAADREAQLLYDVREHAGILQVTDYITDAPVGPTVLFDAFEGGVPLDAFLRRHPDLSFGERVSLVEQIGHAIAFCHRRGIVHGALGPHAVLVRRNADSGALQTRLFDFQLGAGREVEATSHWSALAPEIWSIYQAPELRQDPPSPRSPQSDLYSLGALAYLVLTGRAPGESAREIDERLAREHHLDPRASDDGVPPRVAEVIAHATEDRLACRADDVGAWIELLLDHATSPDEPDTPEVDPLEARKGDVLGGDLTVAGVLGHGASARVLQVDRESDGRSYALKVSLSADHDARIAEEGRVLSEFRHPRIVQLIDQRKLAGRTCLLLSLAGDRTLQRYLAQEGTASLDFASRYGEDLLSALEELEERQIVHRDIKPANLGVGTTTKSANHLTLFDFSLAYAARTELQVGTSAYRDPWLRQRGVWDAAADRWGTAVTLHEMLTGARPALDPTAPPDAPSPLAAERFDPSARERLVAFFERALHREAELRFPSAKAMRHAWIACFEPGAVPARAGAARPSGPVEPPAPPDLTPADLGAIALDAPIEALPLSLRARNALDRAGLVRAADLLDLPDNRINAVRGVGTRIAAEILDFRRRFQEVRAPLPAAAPPFFPGYRGEDLLLAVAGVGPAPALALHDAGLRTLSALAAAPAPQVEAIAKRAGADAAALHALLDRENRAADERTHPTTLEGWIEALLPRKKKRFVYPRALYGLDDPFTGRADVTAAEVAAASKVTRASVYLALGAARDDWRKHPALPDLRALVRSLIEPTGALPLDRAADALLAALPHDRAAPEPIRRARAAALARLAAEVDRDDPAGLRFLRLHDEIAWLTAGESHAAAIAALGATADALAARPVIASPGEAARVLAEAAQSTPFMALPPERLVELAVLASRGAARSTRLEIYPRGLPAERALELSAAVLLSGSTPEHIAQRVAARYPDAAPLPARPDLDALLAPHGLQWDPAEGAYSRPGERSATTSLGTSFSSGGTRAAAAPPPAWAREPVSMAAVDFDDRITNAVDRRALRVLGVTADKAREAALALGARLGVRPVNLDALLIAALRRQMRAHDVDPDVVHDADHDGPAGGAWPNLVKLAELAAEDVARALLPPREPLLLVQPGLLARYRLEGFLRAVVEASRRDDAAAIFLLVPARDTGGIPRINGALAVPGILPSQAMWVPGAWIPRAPGETPSSPPPGA